MPQETIPPLNRAATHETFASWLLSIEGIKEEIKTRLGNESVNTYAEIEEGEEKVRYGMTVVSTSEQYHC